MSEQTFEQRFVAAWNNIENPELDSENPAFKRNGVPTKYASLAACLRSVRKACNPQSVMYLQRLVREGDEYGLKSFVVGAGETMQISEFPVTVPPNPQDFGRILTYTKRQQVQADWGIVGEEDDDGNAAAEAAGDRGRPKPPSGRKPRSGAPSKPPAEDATKAAKARLWAACKAYAEKTGSDADSISGGVKKRPDYEETAEFFDRVSEEFEAEL